MGRNKEEELAEIRRRLDHIITTEEISDSDKVLILKGALDTIEKSEVEGKVP